MPKQSQKQLFTAVTLDALADLRRFIESAGNALGAKPETVADLVVAANEATTNIVEHGYGEDVGDIEIVVSIENEIISLQLLDWAPYFDPTAVDAPDLTVPPLQRKPGGLGILMIQEFVDHITYERTSDNKNLLILTKGGSYGVSS